jgi:subtilisin family serine protease
MSTRGLRLVVAVGAAAGLVLLLASPRADAQETVGATLEGTVLVDTQGAVEYAPEQLVVGFEEAASSAAVSAAVEAADATITDSVPAIDASVVEVPDGQTNEAIAALEAAPAVEYVEPEVLLQASDISPNDSLWSQQWGPKRIRAPAAWEATRGSAGVVVAVVDTGVDVAHPDLAGALLPGRDFVNNDSNADDDNGHGTAAAGVIAARTNNVVGEAGVCWNCSILPVKVLDANGWGTTSAIAAGIVWAVDQGADVINLSLGGTGTTSVLADAVAHAASQGVVVIAAAGNNGNATRFYPAAYPEVISVAGTDSSDQRYDWSNYGSWVKFAAPGCNIAPDDGGGYVNFCGTSSATPVVSGIAALAYALEPALTKNTFEQALTAGAVSIGSAVEHGRVDAFATLEALGLMLPVNETRPRIVGTPRVGSVLTARNGTWGAAPALFAYRWLRCNRAGRACSAIANQTAPTYQVRARDLHARLRVVVKAINENGTNAARSAPTREIRPAAPAVQTTGSTQAVPGGSSPPPMEPSSPTPTPPAPPAGGGGPEPSPVDEVISEVRGTVEDVEPPVPPGPVSLG